MSFHVLLGRVCHLGRKPLCSRGIVLQCFVVTVVLRKGFTFPGCAYFSEDPFKYITVKMKPTVFL